MTDLLELNRTAYLTHSQALERRKAIDEDRWLFVKWICNHGAEDIERFMRPLCYLLAGDSDRLAACLNVYQSELVSQIQSDLVRRGIDWNTRAGRDRFKVLLRRINNRISRSMGKTSIGLDVVAATASSDPNLNIGITSKSDPAAWGMCQAVGGIMRSDAYAMYYSDRLYSKSGGGFDYDSYITNKWIQLNGRTRPDQHSIEARGATSQWYSFHYHLIYADDLASTEAKQGEATIEDAIRFIASLHGISISERWGGTRYVFNGTIQGPRDDHAALANNPEYLTVCVPIWKHKSGVKWTLSNMNEDGIPVLPELYDEEACRQKRADTLANNQLGAISWLQNFCMTAHEVGAMQFSSELISRSKFTWVRKVIMRGGEKEQVRHIRRYLWNPDGTPKTNPKLNQPCLCWATCGLSDHAYVEFDPLELVRVIGVDQALSLQGDKWAIAPVAQDPYGFMYRLKGAMGRGYRNMIPMIPVVFNKWGGVKNPPRTVGVESNAWQGITTDWLQRGDVFSFLSRRVKPVSPGRTQKEVRIFNHVLANLEQGRLLLDPDDHEQIDEALNYNAASSAPDDNGLDATGIAVSLLRTPEDEYSEEQRMRDDIRAERDWMSHVDPETGIDLDNWFEQVM